jgi:carbon monoxide dehydrogenase subunit G
MASIHKEIQVRRPRDVVWDAIRDVGAIHKRLVPGFVVDCRLEGDSRYLTFGNGMTIREIIVDVDDLTFRHSWSARGAPFTHHNASIQVVAEDDNTCRLVSKPKKGRRPKRRTRATKSGDLAMVDLSSPQRDHRRLI